MTMNHLWALYESRHVRNDNGDRVRQLPGGGTAFRPGNADIRSIPPNKTLLRIQCNGGGRQHLLGVRVAEGLLLHERTTEDEDGMLTTPCRCSKRSHSLDPKRVEEFVELRAGLPLRQRTVDVRSVGPRQ